MYGCFYHTCLLSRYFWNTTCGCHSWSLLTAWATAGILGPMLVFYLREYQIEQGVDPSQAYNLSMYILAGLLVIGLISNLLVKPVNKKYVMTKSELNKERKVMTTSSSRSVSAQSSNVGLQKLILPIAWMVVGIPLFLAIYNTLDKALVIFY